MDCTEAYKEHIMYSFNGFCKVVIRYAAINAWRDRNRRRQREISFEYLTEEKFCPLSTSDEYFTSPYEQYPVTICGQTIILTLWKNQNFWIFPQCRLLWNPSHSYLSCQISVSLLKNLNIKQKFLFSHIAKS